MPKGRDASPSLGAQRRHLPSQDPDPDLRIQILSSLGTARLLMTLQQPQDENPHFTDLETAAPSEKEHV